MTATIDFTRDEAIGKRAQELLDTDPALKAMAVGSQYAAYRLALSRAVSEVRPAGETRSSRNVDADRDEAINAKALKLLETNSQLVQLARTDRAEAFKRAIRLAAEQISAGSGSSDTGVTRASDGALTRPALERARQVHKGAMILLKTDPTLQELAAKNYPKAFDVAHSSADGERGEQMLCVPLNMEANALKPGSREEKVYQNALTTLKTALRSRDSYDSLGAFDEAIRDAEVTTPVDGQPPSQRGGWHDDKPPRPLPHFLSNNTTLPLI